MANLGTIIVGSEKTITSSSYWALNEGVFIISAYGYNFQAGEKMKYFVESCSIVNPKTGNVRNSNPFENIVELKQDYLYDDIYRFSFTESFVSEFYNTFSGYYLEGSEFAVALTAHTSEQMGYSPWVIIQPDEKNLMEFCKNRGWTFTVLSNRKDNSPQNMQEIISSIVFSKNDAETHLISSNKYS